MVSFWGGVPLPTFIDSPFSFGCWTDFFRCTPQTTDPRSGPSQFLTPAVLPAIHHHSISLIFSKGLFILPVAVHYSILCRCDIPTLYPFAFLVLYSHLSIPSTLNIPKEGYRTSTPSDSQVIACRGLLCGSASPLYCSMRFYLRTRLLAIGHPSRIDSRVVRTLDSRPSPLQ